MKNYLVTLSFVFMSICLFAQTYLDIDVNQARDTIEANLNNASFTILDVRTSTEYLPEHINKAFNRDFYATDFELQLDSLNKSRVYLIYCRSGNRSGQTLTLMEELGFETVYNMLGGMNDWNAAGYPTTDQIPEFNPDMYESSISGLVNLERNKIIISPNPTNGIIDLNVSYNVSCKLFSLEGKLVMHKVLESHKDLEISELENGIYILNVEGEKGVLFNGRIIKF